MTNLADIFYLLYIECINLLIYLPGLDEILHEIFYRVLKDQPDKIVPYVAKFLDAKVDARNGRRAAKGI